MQYDMQVWSVLAQQNFQSRIASGLLVLLGCWMRKKRPPNPPMASLPAARLALTQPPFTETWVDFFGPFFIEVHRRAIKQWVYLFTCRTTRAINIDIAHSLDIDSFISAMHCFISRRGKPKIVWQLCQASPSRERGGRGFKKRKTGWPRGSRSREKCEGNYRICTCVSCAKICFCVKCVPANTIVCASYISRSVNEGKCNDNFVTIVYSYNGTNLKERELRIVLEAWVKDDILAKYCNLEIDKHFSPPSGPHFGDVWERPIQSAKWYLYTGLKIRTPTFEVLSTVMTEV